MADFRKPFKSDYLGVIDLEGMLEEGKTLKFTVVRAEQSTVSVNGKSGLFNICYFQEQIKPLVLNSTNSKKLREIAGSKSVHIEQWVTSPLEVELYIDAMVKMKGEVVGGVRMKKPAPAKAKENITPERYAKAVELIKAGSYKKETLIENFNLTKEQQDEVSGL